MLAFIGGTLLPEERPGIEEHVAECSACADLVTWAAADQSSSTIRLAGHEGRPFVGELHPGARVDRYQILSAVGRGGMGEVYAAYHPDLDRRIALKVVHGVNDNTKERRLRLLREARAIAKLSHPNVVTVHDAGTFGDRVFIAMELIDGRTIDQWLRAEPRTWQQVLDVFIAAGRGLAAAHAAGVIHRDFKPQNVMIGRNGDVRVMDFGLARLSLDDVGDAHEAAEDEPTLPIMSVTKTGAIVGTPAYMSPEQFNREGTDARSDQFSFCVALHEALFGSRPEAALATPDDVTPEASQSSPRAAVPRWLRAIILRGASANRERRYPSMEALIAALERGRGRLRRRVSAAAVGVTVLLLSAGGWRLAHGSRIACAPPEDRIAGAWAPNTPADPHRESIHRAFAATGRASAETSWERLSKILDDYMNAWRAMYVQACEATHVRGEQSADVLDLRMSCLNDNLDQVRTLTDALVTADRTAVSRVVTAALDLTPVARCADVGLLRSTVPLPRDERTLHDVQRLRRALAEIETMREIGRQPAALARALHLVPQVEATKYKPLLGELLETIGSIQADSHLLEAEKSLEDAFVTAEGAGDDITAAKAASALIYIAGGDLGRRDDGERWGRIAIALLDRVGDGQARTRAWTLNNLGAVSALRGQPEDAKNLFERAIVLKERVLGKEHPDVAISLDALGFALIELGRPTEGLAAVDRAIAIYRKYSDPANPLLASALSNRGDGLRALRRYGEAEESFESAIEILDAETEAAPYLAGALSGLGEVKLATGQPGAATPLLERALRIYDRYPGAGTFRASTEFALARSLWDDGRDRHRARRLAEAAREHHAALNRSDRAEVIAKWLLEHKR